MKIFWCLIFVFLLPLPQSQAASLYSNSEGVLAKGHDSSLNVYRRRFFYKSDGTLDPQKLDKLIVFLEHQKSLLLDSAKLNRKTNLIWLHGYDNDEAEEKGLQAQDSKSETVAPLHFAIEHALELKNSYPQMTPGEIHEKVETILLFLAAGYTPYPMTLFTEFNDAAKNALENFFEWRIDDSEQIQASNLLLNGQFANPSELEKVRRRGLDLSTLNPPSSPIWTNNDIESYDPYQEVYFGEKLFPPQKDPLPEFYYERMGNGQIKIKTYWFDKKDLNKKGLPKKKDVTFRLGAESYTTSVVTHFARIIGYPALPTAYRHRVKLHLGDVSFEEFMSQWKRIHDLPRGTAITYAERIPGENAIILKGVTLEAYPDKKKYRRMGPFRMGDNGLRNRREYRAMPLYNGLIALADLIMVQSRVDAYKDPRKGWQPLFFIADTGSALGIPAITEQRGVVNEFTWKFTHRDHGYVRLFWLSWFDHRAWKDTTYSDVKWLARRMARIKTKQIDDILASSGFPPPAQALYAEKIKSRINQMILDFDLHKEGFALHPVLSKTELSKKFPEYINDMGLLKEGAQEYPGNVLRILGENFTPYQKVVVTVIKGFQKKFLSLFNPANYGKGHFDIDLGFVKTEAGLGFAASREVRVNRELGPGQHRYLLRDILSISIPLGIFADHVIFPAGLYYTYTFEYVHSVPTMQDIATSRFFSLLNPFSLQEIQRTLGMGEQLIVTHLAGASIGKAKIKVTDDIQADVALLSRSRTKIKSLYFSKPAADLLEVATDYLKVGMRETGFDLRLYLRLAAQVLAERSKRAYRIYRIDTLNETPERELGLQQAFNQALVKNDFSSLEQLVRPHQWIEKGKSKSKNFGLFLWNFGSDTGVDLLEADGQDIILAHKSRFYDRAFNRLWNEKVSVGLAEEGVNYFGNFWNEGQFIDINFEGLPDKGQRTFAESTVKITLSMLDNYCTRREFENDFKEFFQERSGMASDYIRFDMPPELEAYPEIIGTMHWQLSSRALRSILRAASKHENLNYLESSSADRNDDPSESTYAISSKAREILHAFDGHGRPGYQPEEQARDLVNVLDRLIGRRGRFVGRLRGFVQEQDIWLVTSIENMLNLTNPTFVAADERGLFWAPEIGKYQGPSYLDRFRRNTLLAPVFVR